MSGKDLPEEFTIGKADFECLFISDLNTDSDLEEVRKELIDADNFRSVEFYEKDPIFYNAVFDNDPLEITLHENEPIRTVKVPESNLYSVKSTEYYSEHLEDGRAEIFENIEFDERVYLFPNGAFVYKYSFHVDKELTTDDIIFFINTIIKLKPVLVTRSEHIAVKERYEEIHQFILDKLEGKSYTDKFHEYSTILVHEFGSELENILEDDLSKRSKVYDAYRHKIHALSVRTVEQWRKRFPKDADFPDKNIATSSVGFLRLNYRNTIAYEYPYSEKTIRNLYSYGIMEIMAWNVLSNVYIMRVGKMIDRLSDKQISHELMLEMEEDRYEIMEALDEFHNYVTTPSFRARNFYEQAIEILGIDDTTQVLEDEVDNLESIISSKHNVEERREEQSMLEAQKEALTGINQILNAEQSNSVLLIVIQIFLIGSVAFDLSNLFGLNQFHTLLMFIGFIMVPILVYIYIRWR